MKSATLFFNLILFFFTLSNKLLAQTINGRVLDAQTLNVAPYSTLEIKGKRIGWVCDSMGNFTLEIPKDKISENDILIIRSLGFSSAEVLLKSILTETTIEFKLKPSIVHLDTFVVKPKNNSFFKGVNKNIERASSGSSEWGQIAMYMNNDDGIKAIIQNVSFFISIKGKPKTPFRIRFYEQQEDGSPGRDLTQESIIVTPNKGNSWFKVDVSKYKILVPKEGYFVAMEWIFTDKKYYYEIPILGKQVRNYGQCLGNIFGEEVVPITWIYRLGDKWFKHDEPFKFEGKINFFNNMINAEIKPIE